MENFRARDGEGGSCFVLEQEGGVACLVFSIGGPEDIVQSIENVNAKCIIDMLVIDYEKYCLYRHMWDFKFLYVFVILFTC